MTPAIALQGMMRAKPKKGAPDINGHFSSFENLLKCAVNDAYQSVSFVIVSLTFDDDHSELFEDSVKAYKARGGVLNDSLEISYDHVTDAVLPPNLSVQKVLDAIVGAAQHKKILVITAHGNLQWLLGTAPGTERAAGANFVSKFNAWLCTIAGAPAGTHSIASLFSAVVLDSCWSASEPILETYRTNVECCARSLSFVLPTLPVIGINGKTLQSVSVTCYDDAECKRSKGNKDYAAHALVFLAGKSLRKTGDTPTYHLTVNLINTYYGDWLGWPLVTGHSFATTSGRVDK